MANLAKAIQSLRQENKDNADRTIAASKENKEQLTDLNSSVGDLVDMFRNKALKDEENRREQANRPQTQPPPPAADQGGLDLPDRLGITGLLAAVTGAIAGTIAGIIDDIKALLTKFKNTKAYKDIARMFTNLTNAFKAGFNGVRGLSRAANGAFRQLNVLEKMVKGLGKIFRAPTDILKGLGKSFSTNVTAAFQAIKDAVGKLGKTLMKPINAIGNVFKDIAKVLPGGGEGGFFAKMFKPITDFFAKFSAVFGKLFTVFRTIGSKIFVPIAVVMGIFESISAAVDGFTRQGDRGGSFVDKVIGGITGLFGGLTSFLVGSLLDLGKDLISWIAGKLGFEEAEKFLDSFSFQEGITQIFNGIADWFINLKDRISGWFGDMYNEVITPIMNIFSGEGSLTDNILAALTGLADNILLAPVNMIKGLVSSVMDIFGVDNNLDDLDLGQLLSNKLKELARAILPDPGGLVGKFVVPDAVYEWAGIDPETGQVFQTASEAAQQTKEEFKGASVEEIQTGIDQRKKEAATLVADGADEDDPRVQALQAEMKVLGKQLKKAALDANKEYSQSRDVSRREMGLEVPAVKEKEVVTQDLDRMTQENKQAEQSAPVVVAPSSTQVNNNTSNTTAAIVDNNVPTRDYNDRMYGDFAIGGA